MKFNLSFLYNKFKLSRENIRHFFYLSIFVYLISILAYLLVSYHLVKKKINDSINERLIQAARSVDYLLPVNYHDRATNRKAISEIEFNEIMQVLSNQANNFGLVYIYSMVEYNGKLFFTSSSATSYEIRTGQNLTYYWQEYTEADPKFYDALKNMKITFLDYTDRWGTFRSVLIPRISSGGNKYLLCADIEISDIDKAIWKSLLNIILKAIFFTLIIIPVFYVFYKYYKLTKDFYAKTISEKNFYANQQEDLHKKSIQKLEAFEEKYIKILEKIQIPLIILDKRGKIIEANSSFLTLINKSKSEIINSIIFTIPFFQSVKDFEDLILQIEKNTEIHNYPISFFTKKGETSCRLTGALLTKQGNTFSYLLIIEDISSENMYMQEMAKAKLMMEEMQQRKSLFLASMSHEMRTPLNVIIGFLEILKDEGIDNEMKEEYLQIIHANAEHLLLLINDILDFSKIESGQFTIKESPFYLNFALNQYKLWLQEEIKRKKLPIEVKLTTSLSDNESLIYTDEFRLKQVITNLLNNALKFTESGIIEFGYKIIDSNIELFVSDTGPGMTEEEVNKLFNFFTQASEGKKSKHKGFGLGLAISKKIVEMMGGSIRVESKPNLGSTFYVKLPYIKVESDSKKDSNLISKNHDWSNTEFIIADNDNGIKEFISRLLLKHNAKSIFVKDYSELLEKIDNQNNAKFLIFDLDFSIPNMSQFLTYIKRKEKLRIIGMSSNIYLINISKSNNLGFDYILAKPFSQRELEEAIEKLLIT